MDSKTTSAREDVVKTTMRLPRALWVEARKAALDDRVDFQDLVAEAMRAHLAARKRRLR
jgi:predicted DNA-binding ribbon-helix-helix protein